MQQDVSTELIQKESFTKTQYNVNEMSFIIFLLFPATPSEISAVKKSFVFSIYLVVYRLWTLIVLKNILLYDYR